jgi:predicted nucleotidyltransferase component of viral defense system
MQELQTLERFEMEALDSMNSARLLGGLHFGGGTMLRLCHGLNRYSTDMDFWLKPEEDPKVLFRKMRDALTQSFMLRDAENKRHTMVFEIQAQKQNRRLKIEIRKNQTGFKTEKKIAFSRYSNLQVVVNALTLEQMMANKIATFTSRQLIRDCFDIEFLLRRGVPLNAETEDLEDMLKTVERFTAKDFKITLGSILEPKDRAFFNENRFMFLKEEIRRKQGETKGN